MRTLSANIVLQSTKMRILSTNIVSYAMEHFSLPITVYLREKKPSGEQTASSFFVAQCLERFWSVCFNSKGQSYCLSSVP